jgi:hypothetical protein
MNEQTGGASRSAPADYKPASNASSRVAVPNVTAHTATPADARAQRNQSALGGDDFNALKSSPLSF